MPTSRFEKWMEEYGEEFLRRLAEEGYSDREIAEMSYLSPTVFSKWKRKHPEFSAALKLGRSNADYAVIDALYKRATGYSVSVNKTYKLKHTDFDPDTGKKVREYEELATGADESYIPADVRASSFWLKNRQPGRWADKAEHTRADTDGLGIVEMPEADMLGEDDCDE